MICKVDVVEYFRVHIYNPKHLLVYNNEMF